MQKRMTAQNLCEELGDVLFQVALHSVIAEEEGLFTIEDVISGRGIQDEIPSSEDFFTGGCRGSVFVLG